MIDLVDIDARPTLDDYGTYLHLRPAVERLQETADQYRTAFEGRTVWMVNSTAEGGGVAEMLPTLVSLLREVGVATEWAVIGTDHEAFFPLTKTIHNLLHGAGEPALREDHEALYATVSRELADAFEDRLGPDDVLVVHDPQPLGMGALLKERTGVPAIWRCHIGLDYENAQTRAAWDFLQPWIAPYDQTVFSLPEYVPQALADQATIINPAIDPLSPKNRDLPLQELTSVLVDAALTASIHPPLTPPYEAVVKRLQTNSDFAPATQPEDLGVLFRPTIVQVSRWDELKGFAPLMEGFARLKKRRWNGDRSTLHQRRLDLARLVLAGPDPASIQDDPEAQAVFQDLTRAYQHLHPQVQRDVAVLMLPMDSLEKNALIVNALQRCALVVVQNSLREGFGLTATEGMWKGRPILASDAVGLRAQVRDGTDGRRVREATDPDEIARTLDEMLSDAELCEAWGHNARNRAAERFLVFEQVRQWIQGMHGLVEAKVA